MGIVFGVTGTKGPAYNVLLKGSSYEIRAYEGFLTAETHTNGDDGFSILANYIGVFGKPANEVSQALDMTHPVFMETTKKIDMTSPVLTQSNVMKFVLPAEYKTINQAPRPTNSRVVIKQHDPQYVAVVGFSGWYSEHSGLSHLIKLSRSLKADGFITTDEANAAELPWSVAQYHPPFTLPFLRLNEVWVRLDPAQSTALRKLLEKQQSDCNKHPDL